MSDQNLDDETRYRLIRLIDDNPNISQRELAAALGISLGKANYCVRALINIGWIKMGKFAKSPNKLGYAYALTPMGIREKTLVTVRFLKKKQQQYELLQAEIASLQRELSKAENQKGIGDG